TVFKTFLKDKEKIVNALQLPYSNAKLEATNNLIKLIKRNSFGSLLFDVQSDEDSSFKFFKVSISLDDLNEVIIVN
ncbi:transposase, partial [Streptococcus pneumoniae]|uniref:transposase n=3 Tax=Streptococcus pneumoniae TaxID=1313 RepID=UPI001D0528D5